MPLPDHLQDHPLAPALLPIRAEADPVQFARMQPRRRVKHFSPPSLSGCDYLKHGAPSARGHVVKGHVARPARNPAVDRTIGGTGSPLMRSTKYTTRMSESKRLP